jgi:nucleoside-diphosphate-sugar epimerase
MAPKALLIGGTGPSGPLVAKGLLDLGYELTLLHRGYHEPPTLPKVHHHLHGDPYAQGAIAKEFEGQTFDLVVCTYGRVRYVADIFAGRTARFVAASGTPSLMDPRHLPFPRGRELPLRDGHPTYFDRELDRRGSAVAYSERQIMQHHLEGHFAATIFRFTAIYGPYGTRHWIGPLVKRVLDGRTQIIVPGDGSQLVIGCYSENAARQILLGCQRPEAGGQIFETVDDQTFTLTDGIRLIAEALDHQLEIVPIAHPLANRVAAGYGSGRGQRQFSTYKQRVLLGYRDAVPVEEAIRLTARWMRDHAAEVDWNQMTYGGNDPLDYATEDRLVASAQEWARHVTDTIPEPKMPVPPEGEWREVFNPVQSGGIIVDGNWNRG